jgi:formylglycine-generating enzyme required for sulfatase activity
MKIMISNLRFALPVVGLLLTVAWLSPADAAPKPAAVAVVLPPGVIKDCPDCPLVNVIPAGRFMLGSPPNDPEASTQTGEIAQLPVVIDRAFAMGRTEITRGQYRAFAQATQRTPIGDCRVAEAGGFVRKTQATWENPGFHKTPVDDDPVVCVSWDDAHAYAEWLSGVTGHHYRLPSETEWEYAARSGTQGTRFFAQNDSDEMSLVSRVCDYANVYDFSAQQQLQWGIPHARCNDGVAEISPVAKYKPNAFDLYDMLGNAREWLEDCYTASYVGRPADGQPWVWAGCPRRGVRGGSFASRPSEARSAQRGNELQATRQNDLGFRVVRELE